MRTLATLGAAAFAVAFAASASAQTPDTDTAAPPAGAASSSAASPSASSAPSAGASAVMAGQVVKDKTGAPIGKVTEVKPDAAGKQVATIQMGADVFAVDTSALAVDNGAATINATQAEIKGMMKK
jgi:hypothetical protein